MSGSATPTTPAIGLGSASNEALEREIRNLKTVMAQQSRQISNMALTMDVLKSEIMSLKEKSAE
jgi:phage host-nuclease inhibitor protein Gam